MAERTYERIEHEGTEYIKLLESDTLRKLDVSWCQTRSDVQALNRLYQELMNAMRRWFWVDTGVQLRLLPTDYGFVWMVEDSPENSKRVRWLVSRATRFEDKIVKRINDYASVLSDDSSKIGEVVNGTEEG